VAEFNIVEAVEDLVDLLNDSIEDDTTGVLDVLDHLASLGLTLAPNTTAAREAYHLILQEAVDG